MENNDKFNKGIITDQTPSLGNYRFGIDNVHITGVLNPDKTYKNNLII